MNHEGRTRLIQGILQHMASLSRVGFARGGAHPKDMPTHAQLGIMFVLMHRKAQSIKELALQFGISSSAATQLVSGMVKEGLLKRAEDAHDRRLVHIDLTAKGKNRLLKAKNARMKLMGKMFEPLSDRELGQFLLLQKKMSDHFKTQWLKNR